MSVRRLVASVGLLAMSMPRAAVAQPARSAAAPLAVDTSLWGNLQWRNIGPNSAGRMVAVAGSTARPREYYVGTTGGGVWKSTDGGATAVPVTDQYFGGTIGAIAVAPSNPDIVYVGGGETPIRGNVSHGEGVWKSTDAGKTWTSLGLRETQYISRVKIHPLNPNVVWVGALGHVFGPNAERGVYKTTDGGKTWRKVLFRNDSTGIADLVMDPTNPDVLYAAFWQAGRKPWLLVSGGAGSGIFKSTDGGETWKEISRNPGLPAGVLGRIGLTVSPAKPSRVWALIEHEPNGGVYRSDDGGATWTFLNGDRDLRQRAWYYTTLFADPADTNVVYAPNVAPMWSRDGGKTFTRAFGGGDNHDMWIDPNDPKRVAVAHDNGLIVTTDGGTTSVRMTVPTEQFYHVHLTHHLPYHVCGASQDGGSYCGPVRSAGGRGRGGGGGGGRGGGPATPAISEFYGVAGGESGYIASNPLDPDITYGGNYSGTLEVQNRRTGLGARLDPWPLNPMGHDARDSKYRFQWTFPIVNSPHDPHVLYAAGNVVFKSNDDGKTWRIISPDLSRNDPSTLGPSGGPITKDQTSVEYYATVFALQESPVTPGVLWAGSDDGLVHVTRDGGKSWKNVTPKGLPEWTRISIIDPSPHAPGTAWVAANRYQLDDFAPYLYQTTDYGATWTKITNGIPATEFTRAIREDLVRRGLVYAATERGMYLSYDAGANWQPLQRNLPPVPVHDIALRDDDIAIATHGRSFWVMENIGALRQAPEVTAAAGKNFLYRPNPVYRTGGASGTIMYRLARADQPVTVEFLDAAGTVLRRASSTDSLPTAPGGRGGGRGGATPAGTDPLAPAPEGGAAFAGRGGGAGAARVTNRTGVNTFSWNLRYPDAVGFQGMILWAGGLQGPLAPPGTYSVRVTVGNEPPLVEKLVVRRDPRSGATDADLVEQHRLALRIRDRVSEANNGVRTIRNVKAQLGDRTPKMSGTPEFAPLAKTFADSLSAVEDSLYQTKNRSGQDPLNYPVRLNNQLAALMGFVGAGDRRPPPQAYEVFNTLSPQLDRELARLRRVMNAYLSRLNAMLRAAGQPEIVPSPDEPPSRPVATMDSGG